MSEVAIACESAHGYCHLYSELGSLHTLLPAIKLFPCDEIMNDQKPKVFETVNFP